MDSRRATGWFERALWVTAVLCLGFFTWSWLDSRFYQMVEGRYFDELWARWAFRPAGTLKLGIAAETRAEIDTSGVVGRLEIPRLGVRAIVAEGIDPGTLRRAAGHLPGTALPGEPGNVAIAGHRDSFFRDLRGIRSGDRVRLTTPDGVFEYRVVSKKVVRPDQTEVLSASAAPTLTLITCFPFRYVGAAPDRFIVRARQVDAGEFATSSRRLSTAPGG